MVFLLTLGIVGTAFFIMSLALIFTGENKVHSSCAATAALDGDDHACAFCPNDEEEDALTTIAKAGYPGRSTIVSEEAYRGKQKRNIIVEKLKYNSGRE